jgi:hypothetical protein
MILSTYDKFYKAIEQNEIQNAEHIFAYSDIRCELISYSMKYCDKDSVISIVQSFLSKGLREQALDICDNCSVKNCQMKQELLINKDVKYYTSDQNKSLNNKHYFNQIQNEKIFDIHSDKYIEN